MRTQQRDIFAVYRENSTYFGNSNWNLRESEVQNLLANIYAPGPSCQFVFDFKTRDFAFVSPSCKNLFGLNPEGLSAQDYAVLIHPKDLEQFVKFENIGLFFFHEFIEKTERPNYKASYQLRIKCPDGNYRLFLHQAIAIAFDQDYKMRASLVIHSDISHLTTTNNNRMSFIHVMDGKSYYNISRTEELQKYHYRSVGLNPREIQILGLISEGMGSKDIAEYLNISPLTVKTHRRNILSRNDFQTIPQAIAFYIREGLL